MKEKTEVQNTNKGKILLPEKNDKLSRVIFYLCNARGLDWDIVKDLIVQKKIYETKQYHNVCFISYDKNNVPRHAFLRGTVAEKPFKMDVPNSDKAYSFMLEGYPQSNKVYCFESSIDAISHATLYKKAGMDYKDGYRISLHCTSFLGLEQFLQDHPHIEEIVSCLVNDKTGILRSKKLCEEYHEKGYKTFVQPPTEKDYNEQLLNFLKKEHELEFADCVEMD